MKILTKEEEAAHYNATLKGGFTGGGIGLVVGGAAVYAANARFHGFRQLTLPMKTFLVTSSSTFAAIVNADRSSRAYETARDPQRQYRDKASSELEELRARESTFQKTKDWCRENRYPIVTASWFASMAIALGLVGRNPYLSKAQKLVQARVYAQGLTLAVLVASAAFEVGDASKGKGRWETVKYLDPNDPEHKKILEKKVHHEAYEGEDLWRDMVAAEERKMDARKQAAKEEEQHNGHDSKSSKSESNSDNKSDNQSDDKSDSSSKGKSGKEKAISEATMSQRTERPDAHEHEAKNQQKQNEKHGDAKSSASHAGAKVKDRGEYSE